MVVTAIDPDGREMDLLIGILDGYCNISHCPVTGNRPGANRTHTIRPGRRRP
jgi:hypothetical protein